ncbi:MAG: helicase-related protein [Cyanobacteriota bacterium]
MSQRILKFRLRHRRSGIHRQLEAGEIRCISSINCLTEGFDIKSISFVVLVRTTKLRALYIQVCGRGIRSYAGKEDCVILDFGGNVERLGFLHQPYPITLEPKPRKDGEVSLKECPACGHVYHTFVRLCPESQKS